MIFLWVCPLYPEKERLSLPENWEGRQLGSTRKAWVLLAICILSPSCGNSSSSSKPKPTPALPPTNLVATQATTARIDLTWTDNSDNEAGFKVERSEDGGITYLEIASLPKDTQAYSDLGLLPGKTYFYRVAAWNSLGSSAFAGPANAATKAMIWKPFTTGGPGFRADHSAIYDSPGHRMIVFGGQDDFFTYYNDLWSFDLSKITAAITAPWSPLTAAGSGSNVPTPRVGHSAVYDSQYNRMIVFGGQDAAGYQNDVYILTLDLTPTWTRAAVTGTPPSGRLGHTAIYDFAHQQMVVFGGNDLSGEKADTLLLSLPQNPPFAWTPSPSGGGPVKRTEHAAIYDGFRQQMLIFGGLDNMTLPDGSIMNNDTWSLTFGLSSSWTLRSFASTPSFRQGHSAVYDAANQRMVVFGGDTTTVPTASSEFWALRLDTPSTWIFLSPGTPPDPRYGHTSIYDSGFQRVVIFGGYDNSTFPSFSDTWLSDF
jgi:hypothetical protein